MKVSSLISGKAVYTVTAEASIASLVEMLASLKVGALVVSPGHLQEEIVTLTSTLTDTCEY